MILGKLVNFSESLDDPYGVPDTLPGIQTPTTSVDSLPHFTVFNIRTDDPFDTLTSQSEMGSTLCPIFKHNGTSLLCPVTCSKCPLLLHFLTEHWILQVLLARVLSGFPLICKSASSSAWFLCLSQCQQEPRGDLKQGWLNHGAQAAGSYRIWK